MVFSHLTILVLGALLLLMAPTAAQQQEWDDFLEGVRADARSEGVSEATLNVALSDLQPIPRVIELDRRQPEGTVTFEDYMETRVPAELIDTARQRYAQHEPLLVAIADHFGLDPEFIVALWGLETRFGSYTGGFDVVASVATLAWDERRSDFFRAELMHALRVLDEGHIARDDMKGSWAGAMGQSQFMPSSFNTYAYDWDLDGHRDIWTNKGDVFASAANYLSRSGWREGLPWGGPVSLPAGFDTALKGNRKTMLLSDWLDLGVTWIGTGPVVALNEDASLAMPGGEDGPAWLVFENYRTILKWNRSDYFAISVVTLADAIAGR
ncbi:MAG: lytic murein transglycosylase [Rhodospirillales bacterium]|nr:lytic murein transglycosylase [Rhodospirillales bacterium]